jgi:hypothetical protein
LGRKERAQERHEDTKITKKGEEGKTVPRRWRFSAVAYAAEMWSCSPVRLSAEPVFFVIFVIFVPSWQSFLVRTGH